MLALLALGCGGAGAPSPDSYCGDMPDSGHFGLSGRVVLVVAADDLVLGTLQNGSRKYEIRGELTSSGVFRGVIDGDVDYDVSGSLLSSRNEDVNVTWTIDGPGDQDDTVSFRLGRC
ncbi:MAG: hypothetical protein ACAH95_10455 [Fimbriimonas sp.]